MILKRKENQGYNSLIRTIELLLAIIILIIVVMLMPGSEAYAGEISEQVQTVTVNHAVCYNLTNTQQ